MKVKEIKDKELKVLFPGKKVKVTTSKSFEDQLRNKKMEKWKEKMDKLLIEIETQGENLEKNLTFLELKKYREKVQIFMEEVVNKSYQREEEKILDKKGRQKILSFIKKVNEDLDELTKMFLSSQIDHLTVLALLDEIRGLLIDIYS